MLLNDGNGLNQKISKAQSEIKAMENTIRLMNLESPPDDAMGHSGGGSLSGEQRSEFERIYAELMNDVFRYAVSCVGRREIAEEITSEVFLALYRNMASMDREWVRAWLFRVAKNQAVNYWRRRVCEKEFAAQCTAEAIAPESAIPPQLEESILESTDLKPSHRACLTLRYAQGLERDEIARRTGLSANQVKSCLQYGLQLLRKQFGGKEG